MNSPAGINAIFSDPGAVLDFFEVGAFSDLILGWVDAILSLTAILCSEGIPKGLD